jgi:hypothetical protein
VAAAGIGAAAGLGAGGSVAAEAWAALEALLPPEAAACVAVRLDGLNFLDLLVRLWPRTEVLAKGPASGNVFIFNCVYVAALLGRNTHGYWLRRTI